MTEATKPNDMLLDMAIGQGYVPSTCTLNGNIVMGLLNAGQDPCIGCNGSRDICKGRPRERR